MIALRGHSEFLSEYDYFDDADLLGWTNTIKLNGEKKQVLQRL